MLGLSTVSASVRPVARNRVARQTQLPPAPASLPVFTLPAGFLPPGTLPVAGVVKPNGMIAWCVPPSDDDDMAFDDPTTAEIEAERQSIQSEWSEIEERERAGQLPESRLTPERKARGTSKARHRSVKAKVSR